LKFAAIIAGIAEWTTGGSDVIAERSEAIHQATKQVWIASLLALLAGTVAARGKMHKRKLRRETDDRSPRATAAASKDGEIELFGLASDLWVTSRGYGACAN
jgi:hypothetical protein